MGSFISCVCGGEGGGHSSGLILLVVILSALSQISELLATFALFITLVDRSQENVKEGASLVDTRHNYMQVKSHDAANTTEGVSMV